MGQARNKQLQKLAELQKRELRFTPDELDLIRTNFKGNFKLILTLKKFLLQGELTEEEQGLIETLRNERMYELLKKVFVPDLDPAAPLGQSADFYVGINTKEKTLEYVNYEIEARRLAETYLKQQFFYLLNKKIADRILLADLKPNGLKTPEKAFVELDARNFILGRVDFSCSELLTLSELSDDTPQEIAAKLQKDSAK